MIAFDYFPAFRRASMVAIEMKGKKRSTRGVLIPENTLIVGQYDSTKTAVIPNVPVQAFTADEIGIACGYGSEIHRQALWIFAHLGGFSENIWYVPVAEPTGSPVAAAGDVVFAGTSTSAGVFYFSIGGDLISLSVAKGAAAAAIGTAFQAAITAAIQLAVKSSGTSPTCTLTAKWKGATGNEILIKLNPAGAVQANQNPSGITLTLPSNGLLTAGAGDPVLDAVLFASGADNLKDRWYTFIQQPYIDATAITAMKTSADLRADPATKRWFAAPMAYVNKVYADAYALPAAINHKSLCPIWEPRSLSPNFELAAALCGAAVASALVDPGRPFHTLPLGIPVDPSIDNLLYAQNDALFRAGMGYCMVDSAGVLRLGDVPTSYRTTAAGAATEEWFDLVSITRRQQKAFDVDQAFRAPPFDRAMLGSDDLVTGKDYVVKPKMFVTTLINIIDYWASQGWTKNPEEVKESVVAEINAAYSGRLDQELTDDEASALRIVATKYAFLY